MASSPFNNIAHLKSYRIALFSQLFSPNSSSDTIVSLPRKLRPRRSRNLHLSVYPNNSSSSSSSSSCHISSVDRNLFYLYSQRRHAFDDKNPEPETEGDEAEDKNSDRPLLQFFSAIAHRKLSQIPADHQWPFGSCFLSFLQAFQRRKQYWYWLGVFLYLIEVFGNNFEFVFKETLYDGLHIGIQWKFESEKILVPLGKGFSFSISHSYKGKAMIRNMDTFIEPLLHLLPFRLKIMATIKGLREGIDSLMAWESKNKSRKILTILIALLAITALFFLLRIPSFKLVFKLTHES